MANEEDSSVSEDHLDETPDLQELINHIKDVSTRIQRKKTHLLEFVSSMKKENSVNKTVLKRLRSFENDFKESKKSKADLKEVQNLLDERTTDVESKLERIENALIYISSKEEQITTLNHEISNFSDDEKQQEEISKTRNEILSLFSEIKIKFRECKKIKLSLLAKFKPEDLIQSVTSWEKAAEAAREINERVNDLQKELQTKTVAIEIMEEELKQEKENVKEQEKELIRLAEDVKIEDESKKEQVVLINTFRSLLDESEKLVRNLEAQNSNLKQIILDERNRVSDLRGKLSDLQEQMEKERRSNREMSLKFEHMKGEYHTAATDCEGYKRDLEMIRKELADIKETKDEVSKKVTKSDDDVFSGDSLEELKENLELKDKLLAEKYFELEQLKSELEKSSARVVQLESDALSKTEDIKALNDKVQVKDKEVAELKDILSDTQTALESEKLAKDQFLIKCDVLERKNSLLELQLQEQEAKDGKENEDREEEMLNLRKMLEEERQKVVDSASLVDELEEQLRVSEELREFEEDIKTRSIENIFQAESENRKLMEIIEELKERLSEKDSGIEELIAHCAVEELKLREGVIGLTNQLQRFKRDCVYKANVIERLRRKIESYKGGHGIVDEEDEETETDSLLKAAELERELHEEKLKTMKYEEALLALNKQYEEAHGVIREKDHELSKKSAEDGKRIAELLQQLESDKKSIMERDEQIENLEEILSLKEVIDEMEIVGNDTTEQEEELKDMKDDYTAKKLRRKTALIFELKEKIESLKNQVGNEQKGLQKQETLIRELNEEKDKVSYLEDENSFQKEYMEELNERVNEGQRLISEMEGVADRERMRVATIEQLLLQDKYEYSKHLVGVKNLKKKVDNYHSNVGELRSKVDRINRNLPALFSPRNDSETKSSNTLLLRLQEKSSAQKLDIQELDVNVRAMEENNKELDAELKEQKGESVEQDEKIDELLIKSKECEDLVAYMKRELELVRKRYQGLSGEYFDKANVPIEDRIRISEDIQRTTEDELQATPMLLFPLIDEENEGDEEHEEEESEETVYFDDESESQHPQEQESQAKQRELICHLRIFESVFEQIFAEEGKRIDVVLEKFGSVIHKNTELVVIIQNLRQTLNEARTENNKKENEITMMKQQIKDFEEGKVNDRQNTTIDDLNNQLEEQRTRSNQLQDSLSVEQLLKSECEKEIENLKRKNMEERETAEKLREDVEREINARYEFEVKLREIEEEAYSSASIINQLQKDLETERKCYGVVTERLQAEQLRLEELNSYVKEAEESANNDKELVEELRRNLSTEENLKIEFLNKLEKLEKESFEKDEQVCNLMNQLGSDRNKMEELLTEIDLEKMTKAKAEEKLQELEENFSRDEMIFEELRKNIDSESAKNREVSELLDKERERNLELDEKTKELEKQVLMDLELFDELKSTIEKEREHNRELDALLNEKNSVYNSRDKLLAELDDRLAEMREALKKEQLINEDLNQELKKQTENEAAVVNDLQDMLKSQTIYIEEVVQKTQTLTETNEEQSQKIYALETALAKLKEVSAQVSKELEEELEVWGEFVDGTDDTDENTEDCHNNNDNSTDRDALRMKTLLNKELKIKEKLMNKSDECKKKVYESEIIISRLKDTVASFQENVHVTEEALNSERKQREENEIKLNKAESDLQDAYKSAHNSKIEIEKLKQIYNDISREQEEKAIEIEQLTKLIDEKAKDNNDKIVAIEKMQSEKEDAFKEKKEKEDECELMKRYYEEEHKFARERLEQNQLLKKQIEELEKAANDKEMTLSKIQEENIQLSKAVDEISTNFENQAILLKEHKDRLKNMDAKDKRIKDLEKEIEELRLKTETTEELEAAKSKRNLKEIEDELSQKDEEIEKLSYECTEFKSKNEESNKRTMNLEDQLDRYKQLLKQHEGHAQKSANALEKARLLCELLKADAEIKDLTISQLNSDVQSRLENGVCNKDKTPESLYTVKKHHADHSAKESEVDSEVDPPIKCESNDILKRKDDEQTEKLREQIDDMAKMMEKVKELNQRVLAEKDKEIQKQKKMIAMIKNLYYSLKTESKRDEILSDVQILLPEKEANDVAVIMNDLENQLKSIKYEFENKAKTVKGLKQNILEIKHDGKGIDRDLLSRKEKVHQLLSIQLEEKAMKIGRMENLLEGLRNIYNADDDENIIKGLGESKDMAMFSTTEPGDVHKAKLLKQETREACSSDKRDTHEDELQNVSNVSESLKNRPDVTDRKYDTSKPANNFNSTTSLTEAAVNQAPETTSKRELIEMKNSKDTDDRKGASFEIPQSTAESLVSGKIDAKDFPKSGWKAKVLAYIVIGIGLSFLPHYLKVKTLRFVLAGVVVPLFYAISALEVNVYRKKAESYLKSLGLKANITEKTNSEDYESSYLLDEERKLKLESDQKLIQGLKEQLQQEVKTKAEKSEIKEGNDESDALEEQKRKIIHLERMLHTREKAKIKEQEQNKTNFDEYIKLRNAVEDLKRKRGLESNSKLKNIAKHDTTDLEADLNVFFLRLRSLPLWIALAVAMYQLTTLHPAAPCGITILFTLYAVNSWYKIKTFRFKLLEERENARDKTEELGELTELLEKEHEVVETQKAAIEIMVREIDNEFVSRKEKAVTLAKMILQMKELDEIKCALKEENIEKEKDPELEVKMRNISEEKASERAQLYFKMSQNLPDELEEESLDTFREIEKTVKDLVTFAEARMNEAGNIKMTSTVAKPRKVLHGERLITIAGVGISTVTILTSVILKSYIPAVLVVIQLVLYLISLRQQKHLHESTSTLTDLQAKLDREVKRNKANRLQIGKLKRLLATEKSLKKSDEAAKEIRQRVKERAEKKKLAADIAAAN